LILFYALKIGEMASWKWFLNCASRTIATFILLTPVADIFGQELEPRAYVNVPVGLNYFVAGYSYSSGGVLFDPAIPLENANIKTHATLLAYARSIKVGKMSGKIDAIIPFAHLSGTAEFMGQPGSREVTGMCDPRIRMSVIFLGGPALSLAEYQKYKQNFIMGASLQVILPLGQYDDSKLVNLGTNRFAFKPEIGISKTFNRLVLELATAVNIYTENHNSYGGKTLIQDPIGSVQSHVIYNFKKGIWTALDATYYWGGNTTIDGVQTNSMQENSRIGLTFALPINIHHSIKLNLSTGTTTRTGTDFDSVILAWQYRFGSQKSGK
jgi:hypothetical protein